MTPEQRARIAREVTGDDWQVINWGVADYVGTRSGTGTWDPDFNGDSEDRLQALALVEWLADRIEALPAGHRRFSKMDELLIAINKRDLPALLQLALELLENGNG